MKVYLLFLGSFTEEQKDAFRSFVNSVNASSDPSNTGQYLLQYGSLSCCVQYCGIWNILHAECSIVGGHLVSPPTTQVRTRHDTEHYLRSLCHVEALEGLSAIENTSTVLRHEETQHCRSRRVCCLCAGLCVCVTVTNWWATNTLYYSLPDPDKFVTDKMSIGGEASRSVDDLLSLKTLPISRDSKTNVTTLSGEFSVQTVITSLLKDGTWPADPDAVYGLITDSTIQQVMDGLAVSGVPPR